MKKHALLLTVSILGSLAIGINARASKKYTIVSQHWDANDTYYKVKNPKKSISLWNKKHTKKVYNLKMIPNRTWSKSATLILKHGKSNVKYYYVNGFKANNKTTISGYIWNGYLQKGLATDLLTSNFTGLQYFSSTKDYRQYIQDSPSQAITREIIKLFPNSKVTLDLSQISTAKGGYYVNTKDYNPTHLKLSLKTTNYKNFKAFPDVVKYLNQSYQSSTKTRITKISKLLAADGYDSAKRAQLKNYEIGINIFDHSMLGHQYHDGRGYSLIIAQKK